MARNDYIWDDVEDILNEVAAVAASAVGGFAIGLAAGNALIEAYEESNKALPNKEYYIDDDD